ncbi:hypothetical protein Bca52824_018456 [Brassica carinata]|uniref:GBF-interacting protein 1 N-terminal domain-containing protein n=1 Tax=Brassica carinata TaxID=52824 RepID=A0A8X7VQ40_BRACI|nr:hypothetical protein Bca52824_018456 [Brassica carinata]
MGGQGSVSKMVQQLKEIVNCSDSEIYNMLVECNMEPNKTVIELLSQDSFQEVKSKRNKKKDTKDQAESSRRRIPNRGARNSAKDSYNTARGGRNKFNSNETRLAQSVSANRRGNHWAGSSSAQGVRPPPNSVPKNAEVKKAAPTGSTGAATSSSLPARAYQSAWASANPGKKTMAEIVKMGKPLHQKKVIVPRSSETQESGSKAPLKDEGSSTQKQDVSEPVSSILQPATEPKTHADQVSDPQHVNESRSLETQGSGSKAPLKDEGPSKRGVSGPASSLLKPSAEPKTHAEQVSEPQNVDESQMDDEVPETKTNPVAFHPDVDQVAQCSHLRFGTFGLGMGSGQASSGFNDILQDTQETGEDSSFRHLNTNFYEGEEEELRDDATDETYYHIDLTARNDHASSDSEAQAAQHERPQEDPQMQNFESFFTNLMDLRGARQQAAALNQHPALNAYYHQHGMPLGHHGNNFTSYPFMPHGYTHWGFQQGFNHQAPLVVVFPHSAPSLQQQNENSTPWQQIERPNLRPFPRGGDYAFRVHPNQQPPGFVQALHQQQLSQQSARLLDQLHHHHEHHHYHHEQRAGEASRRIREQLWPNNN